MYIYADVVFVINIMMNSIILLLTAWTAGIQYKLWRIALAACVGSCYVLACMLPDMIIVHHGLCKILMSLILILLAFGLKPGRTVLLLVAFFYVIAFMLGGAVIGWLYFWQTNNYLGNFNMISTPLSWQHLLWGSCVGVGLISIVLRRMVSRMTCKRSLYPVKIEYGGRTVELTALLDTGNGLYTVIGHKPVMLVNQHAIEPILSEQVVAFLQNHTPEMWLANLDTCTDMAWIARMQVIPYHAIGNNSMLLAFRPDRVMVASQAGFMDVGDVCIAIYSGVLSGDGTYDVLLHPQMMNELSKKEGVQICA